MHIGKAVLVKYEGKIQEFIVKDFRGDTLTLTNGLIDIQRFYWEIHKTNEEKTEE
jgi:hypothetical protein